VIKAKGEFHGQPVEAEVVNPGDWFGKTWLLEIAFSNWPLFLVVEADSPQDVIDELAENEKHRHHIVVDDADLGDYPEDDRHYGPSGQVLDLDNLMIHGREHHHSPWPCRYYGEGLPEEGVHATKYPEFRDEEAD
jgi:hypothetical protein